MANKYDPYYWSIGDLFKDNVFTIPVYQRPFSWEKEQISSLLTDIQQAFNNNDSELFIGTMYIKSVGKVNNGKSNRYEIIDGQQRISTLTCVLLVLYVQIRNRTKMSEDHKDISVLRESIWKKISREENNANVRLLESSSIENSVYNPLFNEAFNNVYNFKIFYSNLKIENDIQKRVYNCFSIIDKFITDLETEKELLDFSDYIMNSVKMIVIETSTDIKSVFNMFESLNSKGKHLEEIDLIKTYIFSLLPESDYENYLKKWGELTLLTNDKLEDYLWIFIKSFIRYYKYSAKFKIFKPFSTNDLCLHYNQNNISDVLKLFILDLNSNAKYYLALDYIDEFKKITNKSSVVFYYRLFKLLKYEHPRPLLMRLIKDFDQRNISVEELVKAFKSILSFMISFQTLSNRDSKDSISIFQEILRKNYSKKHIDINELVKLFESKMSIEGIDRNKIKNLIENCIAYKDNKMSDIGFALLTIYESIEVKDDTSRISYNKANSILKSKDELSGDHILVQTPRLDSQFKYRITYENDEKILKLLDKHDFPKSVFDGMIYDNFLQQILNKIGNIRLAYRDNNSSRGNAELSFKDENFITYTQLVNRKYNISNLILESNFFAYPQKISKFITNDNENKVVWDNLDFYTGKTPIYFSLLDTKILVSSNSELLRSVFKILYELDSSLFEKFASLDFKFENEKKPIFSKKSEELRSPTSINNTDIYFESNNSTERMLRILAHVVFDEFELDDTDFEVYYKDKN